MHKLRVGIIGLGVGEAHIKGFQKHPLCEVVSLCDFDNLKLNYVREKYPQINVFSTADDILNDPAIEIVSIATYDNYHYEQVIKAITNNKHVFIEKPICLYEHEAIDIYKTLQKYPALKISSNLILRMTPRFLWLRNKIFNQELGEIFYIEGDYNYGRLHKITDGWRGKLPFYSGVYGGGIHLIDLFCWLTSDVIEEVLAVGNRIASKNSSFSNNDMVVALLKYKSGMIAKMAVNMGCVHPHFHNLNVYGTQATFINSSNHGLYYTSRNVEIEPQKITEAYPGSEKGDLIYNFVDSIINKHESTVSKKDVFDVMSVCFAIEKAVNTGISVKVNYFN